MYEDMGHEAMARQWELARVWCAALLVSCPRVTRCYSQCHAGLHTCRMLLFCYTVIATE